MATLAARFSEFHEEFREFVRYYSTDQRLLRESLVNRLDTAYLRLQIAEQNDKLADLLTRYRETSTPVTELRAQIARLEELLRKAEGKDGAPPEPSPPAPVQ